MGKTSTHLHQLHFELRMDHSLYCVKFKISVSRVFFSEQLCVYGVFIPCLPCIMFILKYWRPLCSHIVCICFSGIILYGMVIGKLPFTTHYTDQYRRQKLLSQIERGMTEIHFKELALHGASQGTPCHAQPSVSG